MYVWDEEKARLEKHGQTRQDLVWSAPRGLNTQFVASAPNLKGGWRTELLARRGGEATIKKPAFRSLAEIG